MDAESILFAGLAIQAAIRLAAGGVPAAIIAAKVVESLPLYAVRWLVVVVVVHTALNVWLKAKREDVSISAVSSLSVP